MVFGNYPQKNLGGCDFEFVYRNSSELLGVLFLRVIMKHLKSLFKLLTEQFLCRYIFMFF